MTVFIGWDVGAWNCDKGASRDALCALSGNRRDRLRVIGTPWRGNLRADLCEAGLSALPSRLGLGDQPIVVAIDAPLGWPAPFADLARGQGRLDGEPARADDNPYLFRRTDLDLFIRGFRHSRPSRHDREPGRQGSARTPPVRSPASETGRLVRRDVDGQRGLPKSHADQPVPHAGVAARRSATSEARRRAAAGWQLRPSGHAPPSRSPKRIIGVESRGVGSRATVPLHTFSKRA